MEKTIYFAAFSEKNSPGPGLSLGWGFDETGALRRTGAQGPVVDDRNLPAPGAETAAAEALAGTRGPIVLDFERTVCPALERLARALPPGRLVVPPTYAHLPHARVLIGPYRGGEPFVPWLARQRQQYGPLVLDLAPMAWQLAPGGGPVPWYGRAPAGLRYSPALACLWAVVPGPEGPGVALADTRRTLAARQQLAGEPAIVLLDQWQALDP